MRISGRFCSAWIGSSHNIGVTPSKAIYLPSSTTQEVKSGNHFHFSSHVLGYLEGALEPDSKNTGFKIANISTYSNPYLEIISSRIFRPPRSV